MGWVQCMMMCRLLLVEMETIKQPQREEHCWMFLQEKEFYKPVCCLTENLFLKTQQCSERFRLELIKKNKDNSAILQTSRTTVDPRENTRSALHENCTFSRAPGGTSNNTGQGREGRRSPHYWNDWDILTISSNMAGEFWCRPGWVNRDGMWRGRRMTAQFMQCKLAWLLGALFLNSSL